MEANKKREPVPVKDRLAKMIAGGIIRFQLGASNRLSSLERHLSIAAKKALLVVFCILFGGYCGLVLFRAVLPRAPNNEMYIKKATGADRLPPVTKMPADKSGDTITHKK